MLYSIRFKHYNGVGINLPIHTLYYMLHTHNADSDHSDGRHPQNSLEHGHILRVQSIYELAGDQTSQVYVVLLCTVGVSACMGAKTGKQTVKVLSYWIRFFSMCYKVDFLVPILSFSPTSSIMHFTYTQKWRWT